MKKIIINLIVCICFASCTLSEFDPQTWAIYPELELSESGLVFTNFERERVVSIKTNYQEVSVNSSENWCHPKIETGCLRINVDPNEAIQQREATVSVKVSRGNKSLSRDLSIVQLGGYWDIVGDFSVFWSNESLSNTQKEIINNILTNIKHTKYTPIHLFAKLIGKKFCVDIFTKGLSNFKLILPIRRDFSKL